MGGTAYCTRYLFTKEEFSAGAQAIVNQANTILRDGKYVLRRLWRVSVGLRSGKCCPLNACIAEKRTTPDFGV